MSLLDRYKSFLGSSSPSSSSSSLLAEAASLHYITTLTTINGAANIVKHLSLRQLKFLEQTVMDAIESPGGLALEVETTIEFVSGGGGFVPGLDDNFLADRVVTFPVVGASRRGMHALPRRANLTGTVDPSGPL